MPKKTKTQKTTSAAPASPKPAKKTNAPKLELLEEIQSNFDSFTTETSVTKSTLSLPALIAPKAELEELPSTDLHYGEILIGYLQSMLELPEWGEVKALIVINRFGEPIRCDILESKSRKNGDFLKKRLPELSFPCFNDFSIVGETLEFTITFRNLETR